MRYGVGQIQDVIKDQDNYGKVKIEKIKLNLQPNLKPKSIKTPKLTDLELIKALGEY